MSPFLEARDDDDDRIEVGPVSRYKTKGKYREREGRDAPLRKIGMQGGGGG